MTAGQPPTADAGAPPADAPPFPPLRGVVWFRYGLGLVASLLAVIILVFGLGEAFRLGNVFERFSIIVLTLMIAFLAALIALPSLAVAWALARQRGWAVRLALAHDVLALIALVGTAVWIPLTFVRNGWDVNSATMRGTACAVGGLVFAAEAAYLLRRVWGWRPAWPLFSLLAGGLLYAGMVAPVRTGVGLNRHIAPLLAYVNTHWAAVPQSSHTSVEVWWDDPNGHWDRVSVQTARAEWQIVAHHDPSGGWRFVPQDFAGQAGHDPLRGVASGAERRIESVAEAESLLREVGVLETAHGPGRPVKEEYYDAVFEFRFPEGGGSFRVNNLGGVQLVLTGPVKVP